MVSRVARNPIEVPAGVTVNINNKVVTVKGKLGELSQTVHPAVNVVQEDNKILVTLSDEKQNMMAGTICSLVKNMVKGVSEGFTCKLILIGVGYRAKVSGKSLNLTVGLSHPVEFKMPKDIDIETPSVTEIIVKGVDNQKVHQIAANIRSVRPPEPYKGKGIRYEKEHVVQKEAKKK